jgi:hypothetical protein
VWQDSADQVDEWDHQDGFLATPLPLRDIDVIVIGEIEAHLPEGRIGPRRPGISKGVVPEARADVAVSEHARGTIQRPPALFNALRRPQGAFE